MPFSIRTRLLALTALCAATLALAGCGNVPTRSDAASATTGVTVYGTVDAGVGRVRP